MTKARVSARLPLECYQALEGIADTGGYSSVSALARCILVQFVKNRVRIRRAIEGKTDWVAAMMEEHEAEACDPKNRDAINRRL